MTSKRRREGQENELAQAQADYEDCLIAALQTCAAGQWGLFGVNDAAAKREFSRPLSKEAKTYATAANQSPNCARNSDTLIRLHYTSTT